MNDWPIVNTRGSYSQLRWISQVKRVNSTRQKEGRKKGDTTDLQIYAHPSAALEWSP